jgi:polyketide biosynthesis enoyl-CoA hydratase PksI
MVRLTCDGRIARIVLADPGTANALGEEMVGRLRDAFEQIDRAADVHAVVLLGEGDTFSSGAPRELLLKLAAGEVRPTDIVLPKLLLDCKVPVVAAMAGHATGGGFALGLAADIIVIAEESRYGFTFMNLGFTPGMGTTRLCEHALSTAVAHELLYTGELRRGSKFSGSGINHIVPRAEVETMAFEIAARIAEKPFAAVTTLKRTLSLSRRQAFEQSITQESLMHQLTLAAAAQRIETDYVE